MHIVHIERYKDKNWTNSRGGNWEIKLNFDANSVSQRPTRPFN